MNGKHPHAVKPCGAETRTCRCSHHRKQHEPNRGKCRLCDCRAFDGKPCDETRGLGAGGRCRRHGGASLGGSALPQWKHGRWSKYLPESLALKFQEGLDDPELMQLRQDVALVDAVLTDFSDRVKKGKGLNYRQRKELMDLTDSRRKLIESEARRQRELGLLVPVEKVMQLVAALATLHQEIVPREMLPKAQARMRQLLNVQGATIDVVKTEGEAE